MIIPLSLAIVRLGSADQHAIAVTVEPIALGDSVPVCSQRQISARKSRDHHK